MLLLHPELNQVRHLRKKLGLTQHELAKKSGISQSLIAKIEAGLVEPTYSKAKKLLETLHSLAEKRERKVSSIMHAGVISVAPSTRLKDAINVMKRHSISQLPVVRHGKPVGIISEATILEAILNGKHHLTARDVMVDAPPTLSKDSPVSMALDMLKHYPLLIVQSQGELCGVVTKADVIRKMYSE